MSGIPEGAADRAADRATDRVMNGEIGHKDPGKPTVPQESAVPQASLIEYPSLFPIKVMGAQAEGFVDAMVTIAQQFDLGFNAANLETRASKGGKYLGITLNVTATSREQLDGLYRALTSHPMVKVVL